MYALFLKEIRSFLNSIIGYVFIIIFLIANGLFLWFVDFDTNILQAGIADLIPFFNLTPSIFFILIPAITMRSIAEEKRTGTIELLFTKPISPLQIVMAKFLAGAALVLISILPTIIYYVSIHCLGNPVGNIDDGAAITSYCGLFMLGTCFVAIGIFASSITSSQIVAFILAMFICWFFFDGLDLIGSFTIWGDFDSVIQYAGMKLHYSSIMKGVVDTKDLVYFLSVCTLFLCATYTSIKSYKR
jgi:ABC-2 type transport system permease protein